MKRIALTLIFALLAVFAGKGVTAKEVNGLTLLDMYISISSQGHTATFRLYDTKAAKELYEQLPLSLDLTNFRDAQWMFYPPEKLSVTPSEAYHDGKKGELSYYEPWGDAFMLYKDFYAGDNMHRLGINVSGIDEIEKMSGKATIKKIQKAAENKNMNIKVTSNGKTTVFKLNDSRASKELYSQLPLDIKVEDYGGIEKIFYPPKKLDTTGTPRADSTAGTLAYYAPWGDVVMFYKPFGSASGLYKLGEAIEGADNIRGMSGTITVEKGE